MRGGDAVSAERLLPGYARSAELDAKTLDAPTACWIECVRSFVTLGSPIDKFLILWWADYRHLVGEREGESPSWLAARAGANIRHFNSCEEQDPVGHHLHVARSTDAYAAVFATEEDRVYQRSALPGIAHTAYWRDRDLFRWILARAIDECDAKSAAALAPTWFHKRVYESILRLTYYAPAVLAATYCYYVASWVHPEAAVSEALVAGLLLVAGTWGFKQIVDRSVCWRQSPQGLASLDPVPHPARDAAHWPLPLSLLPQVAAGVMGRTTTCFLAVRGLLDAHRRSDRGAGRARRAGRRGRFQRGLHPHRPESRPPRERARRTARRLAHLRPAPVARCAAAAWRRTAGDDRLPSIRAQHGRHARAAGLGSQPADPPDLPAHRSPSARRPRSRTPAPASPAASPLAASPRASPSGASAARAPGAADAPPTASRSVSATRCNSPQ